jgi:RNA polymerase sigma-70 factor (ECF subfamily)
MDEETLQSRLSRISTKWSVLAEAHRGPEPQAQAARGELFRRYQGAAFRYLLGAVRDTDAAEELFQEFALRFIRGDFRRADPQKGRFRDYLKSALYHLVANHFGQQRKRPYPLDATIERAVDPREPPESVKPFEQSWRDELLARAWSALEAVERQGGQPYFTVLRFRTENPRLNSAEMARQLTSALRPPHPFSESGIRKLLQRARGRFAELLVDDVAFSLGNASLEQIEEELIEVGLLAHCRSALKRRRGGGQGPTDAVS